MMKLCRFSAVALFFFFLFVFVPTTASAKDEWLQVRSKNFYLIGNASEKDIRKVATKLEQFRETFRLVFSKTSLNSPIPTNVVVFKSASAYKPFKPKRADGKIDNFVAGYFQPGEDVNYITLSTEGADSDTYGTIFHEYVHFIVNTNFGKSDVPPWFNEGLAEYYQTFEIEEDQKAKLGLPQSNHLLLLQQNKLIPLDTFFNISNYALHQNANHSRSIFYAQAWALIHYLVQSGKADGMAKFLSLSLAKVPAEKAFQEAFQTSYAQMEKDLKKYASQSSYKYHTVTFKNKLVFDTEMHASQLDEADSNAYLGDLLYHTNRADDAEAYLRNALALNPESSMANTTLGMVKLRQRKYDEAKTYLEKAISQDQKNHLALYRYAYLLSREGRDEFGYVQSFPPDHLAKMREMLRKAIAINPGFTESYELLAFVNLVNNEELDESVAYLQKALKYQPGNQRYAIRIAEIYARQQKFKEAGAIAEKIASTADEPEIKALAEKLRSQLRQQEEIVAKIQNGRKEYEAAIAEAKKNGAGPVLIRRRSDEKPPSPEEIARAEEEAMMRSINGALRKPVDDEKQVVGNILKIECKGRSIKYAVKTDEEVFTLSSKDFQGLILTALVSTDLPEIGCGADIAAVRKVLTYKPRPNSTGVDRGELIAIDFVPNNFRFVETPSDQETSSAIHVEDQSTPLPSSTDMEEQRRAAMMQMLKEAMRKPAAGEKRELGFIEKTECSNKGSFFFIKTQSQTLKLKNTTPESLQIRAFTPDIENMQFGCGMKPVDVPAVVIYKDMPDSKNKSAGEIVSLEFVPKTFVLTSQ